MSKESKLVIAIVSILAVIGYIQVTRYIECDKLGGKVIRDPYFYTCAKVEVIK